MSWCRGAAQTPPWPGVGAHPGRFWGSWITGPDDAPKGQGLRLQSLTDPRSTSLLQSLTPVNQVRGLSLQSLTFSVRKRGEKHLSGASNADSKYTGD